MALSAVSPIGWRSVCFAAVSVCALVACAPAPLEPRDPTPGTPHFKVATYNLLNLIEGDPATLETVGATGADIVCLEEVTPVWGDALRKRYSADYPYMLFQEAAGSSGLAVLSRFPLAASDVLAMKTWHPAWHVDADTPAGWMQLLLVHLRASFSGNGGAINSYLAAGDDRLLETKYFVSHEAVDVPTLILGDFNEGTNGPSLQYLESIGYRNVLPLYHPGQFTWRGRSVGSQMTMGIDHILFDDSFAPLNAWVLLRGNSDHLPVVAHFEAARQWPNVQRVPSPSEALAD